MALVADFNRGKLRAEYDFTDAYNGGNSLKFSGDVAGKTDQD